jgi:lactate dehydrogenase-like 2-hydroxyacid dehydrogenase
MAFRMKHCVLVTKFVFPEALEYLRRHVEVEYYDSQQSYAPDELLRRLAGKQGAVSQLTDKFTREVMGRLPGLRVISNVAVGFDNIDIAAATERKIVVTNTPGVLTETTADFAFTLMMATARRVVEADRFLREGRWREWSVNLFCGPDIHHSTLGLVGMGRIGRAVAQRGRGFDMRVLYHDAIRLDPAAEREAGIEYVALDRLLEESDFVSLHVPLLPETRHLINRERLRKMKKTAILVNTARGPVIDEQALAEALENGVIAGAGLDVFEREPQVEPRLLKLSNAVLVPHIASASFATRRKMCLMAAENMVAALEGKRPPNLVNAELFDGRAT